MSDSYRIVTAERATKVGRCRPIGGQQQRTRTVLSRISWAKSHMLDPQETYLQSADPVSEKIAHIYEIYRKELRKANALDFDDLLLEAVRLLRSMPSTEPLSLEVSVR